MKLCGFEAGIDQPFFLIAGPCVIESEALAIDTAGAAEGDHRAPGNPVHLQILLDKANRSSHNSFRGPGVDEGLRILQLVREQIGVPVLTDVHEDTPLDEVPALSTCCRHRPFCAARPTSSRMSPPGQAGQYQEGPVHVALGHAQCRRQGAGHRQSSRSWSASAASRSATTTWFPTCAPWR